MADFLTAFNYMMDNEDSTRAGKVEKDSDGGDERFGLDSKSNPDLIAVGYYTMPAEKAITYAEDIYKKRYWQPIWGDKILSQRVASKYFDMAVNEDPPQATRLIQRAAYGLAFGTNIDGKIGPNTLKAINDDNEYALLQGMVTWCNWFISQVLHAHPDYAKYEKGWRIRANKLPGV